jgi:pyridoxamine 5'-phosphate oxidase
VRNSTKADYRREYGRDQLDESTCPENPFDLVLKWLDEARVLEPGDPNFVLSSVNSQNRPSSRIVLLKGISEKGFYFFSNYHSKKGWEIANNPNVAANFFWPELERQLRIVGRVARISPEESDEYFNSRPLDSKISAIISNQSQRIPDRKYLLTKAQGLKNELKAGQRKLYRPDNWGGYIIKPSEIEFWVGRPGRLNDRIFYQLVDNTWEKSRLAP